MPLDGNYDESDDSQSLASFSLFLLLSGWYTLCHGICVCNASFWMIAFLFLFFSFFHLVMRLLERIVVLFILFGSIRVRR